VWRHRRKSAGASLHRHIAARDAPTQVLHILRRQADHTATGDCAAAIGEVAAEVDVDGAAREQRAAAQFLSIS